MRTRKPSKTDCERYWDMFMADHELYSKYLKTTNGTAMAHNKFGHWTRRRHPAVFNEWYTAIWVHSPELWDKPYENNIDTSKFTITKDTVLFCASDERTKALDRDRINSPLQTQQKQQQPIKEQVEDEEEEIFPTSNWTTL